jgi:hypothetical protein
MFNALYSLAMAVIWAKILTPDAGNFDVIGTAASITVWLRKQKLYRLKKIFYLFVIIFATSCQTLNYQVRNYEDDEDFYRADFQDSMIYSNQH